MEFSLAVDLFLIRPVRFCVPYLAATICITPTSAFFSRARTASTIGTITFFVALFPYFAVDSEGSSTNQRRAACLLPPTCLALGTVPLVEFEDSGVVRVCRLLTAVDVCTPGIFLSLELMTVAGLCIQLKCFLRFTLVLSRQIRWACPNCPHRHAHCHRYVVRTFRSANQAKDNCGLALLSYTAANPSNRDDATKARNCVWLISHRTAACVHQGVTSETAGSSETGFAFNDVIAMLIVDVFVYAVLAWYATNVRRKWSRLTVRGC